MESMLIIQSINCSMIYMYVYILPQYIIVFMIDQDDNSCRNMYDEDIDDWEKW
jgi:hypothetical protein